MTTGAVSLFVRDVVSLHRPPHLHEGLCLGQCSIAEKTSYEQDNSIEEKHLIGVCLLF